MNVGIFIESAISQVTKNCATVELHQISSSMSRIIFLLEMQCKICLTTLLTIYAEVSIGS